MVMVVVVMMVMFMVVMETVMVMVLNSKHSCPWLRCSCAYSNLLASVFISIPPPPPTNAVSSSSRMTNANPDPLLLLFLSSCSPGQETICLFLINSNMRHGSGSINLGSNVNMDCGNAAKTVSRNQEQIGIYIKQKIISIKGDTSTKIF